MVIFFLICFFVIYSNPCCFFLSFSINKQIITPSVEDAGAYYPPPSHRRHHDHHPTIYVAGGESYDRRRDINRGHSPHHQEHNKESNRDKDDSGFGCNEDDYNDDNNDDDYDHHDANNNDWDDDGGGAAGYHDNKERNNDAECNEDGNSKDCDADNKKRKRAPPALSGSELKEKAVQEAKDRQWTEKVRRMTINMAKAAASSDSYDDEEEGEDE